MTIDPVELERLLTRYEELVGRHYRGTLEVRGQAEKYEADLRLVTDLRDKLRTGQLVPAQPSGDVVEAVWEALKARCCADPSNAKKCVMVSKDDFTAAITAYEAVSGVAKMREALREARSGLCAYTGGSDGACGETIARIDAALGEKP